MLARSAESTEAVDERAERALAAGGRPANEPMEYALMYGRSFQDPDGTSRRSFWMDPSQVER